MSAAADGPGDAVISADALRALLAARGLRLRLEDEAATLGTARFLLRAAELLRQARP